MTPSRAIETDQLQRTPTFFRLENTTPPPHPPRVQFEGKKKQLTAGGRRYKLDFCFSAAPMNFCVSEMRSEEGQQQKFNQWPMKGGGGPNEGGGG